MIQARCSSLFLSAGSVTYNHSLTDLLFKPRHPRDTAAGERGDAACTVQRIIAQKAPKHSTDCHRVQKCAIFSSQDTVGINLTAVNHEIPKNTNRDESGGVTQKLNAKKTASKSNRGLNPASDFLS